MFFRLLVIVSFTIFPLLLNAQDKDVSMFIFGHSLIDHRPPATPTPSDETTVPHWVFLLAEAADHSYAAGGQYGFLGQHANLPPISQWGYDIVPSVWESDEESFADAEINTILITAGNFIQYQGPELPYEDPNNTENVSPISATEVIVDWVSENTNEANIYIYENWPDMARFIAGEGFPASPSEFLEYNEYTRNGFHEWWIAYQDALLDSHVEANVRMIPVGPIISDLTDGLLADVPFADLYEDNAPHGTPNLYFLASLVTNMAVYEEKAPLNFEIPELINSLIRDNYNEVVDFIWDYLIAFNTDEGESRVFMSMPSSAYQIDFNTFENIDIYPNPSSGFIYLKNVGSVKKIEVRNILGNLLIEQNDPEFNSLNVKSLISGQYILSVDTMSGEKYHAFFVRSM